MATSQTEEATDNKQDSEESGAVQESGGEKSKPQESAGVETSAEKAAAEQGAEETQGQKAADDKADSEEKAKAETEAKPEVEEKAEAVEEKGKPEEKTSAPDQSQESAMGKIFETIQQTNQSPAVLPGESDKPTMAYISVSSGICAKDIMQKGAVWANPKESVQQALTKMQQQDSSYIMVGQDGTLEGIVSKSDITGATSIYLRPIFAKWHGPLDDATLQIKLKWIMSRPVRTVRPETPLATIMENMCRLGGCGLPVVDEQGKVQGLVTVFDIFRILLNTSEDVSAVGKTAETPALA